MVVTEREPTPQQGQSPQPIVIHGKNGGSDIDAGISPLPSSTEERLSPEYSTDHESSDCPTPQTPPGFLPFMEPFPSECKTPPVSVPFPEPFSSIPEEPEGDQHVESKNEETPEIESVQIEQMFDISSRKNSGEIDQTADSAEIEHTEEIAKENSVKIEQTADIIKENIAEIEQIKGNSVQIEQTTENAINIEQTIASENSAHIIQTENIIKTEIKQTTVDYKVITEEKLNSSEVVEMTERFEECGVNVESPEKMTQVQKTTENIISECLAINESSITPETQMNTNIPKQEISVNQLWSLWSSSAPKEKETLPTASKAEEQTDQFQSAGQIGENDIQQQQLENAQTTDSKKTEGEIISDDLNDTRLKLGDAERRLHEMEIEIKRLENEREELSSAYREAEMLRKQEEAKAQRLAAELTQVRHDYEKRLIIKEEEIEALRKQMQIEIEQLSQRVAEAEAKVKTEVARIKKKMQIQITELEMSLDVANKQNIDMQKMIKKQSLQITELQAHYDEIHRQLQQTVDQLGVSQRRCQALQAELEELRVALDQALRAKRAAEMQLEEVHGRINELNTLNVNLTSSKSKLEAEFMSLQSDYEEISKEIRISDERYNRVLIDLKSTKDLLIEEQERLVKIESIKKSLEIEVHNLNVRIEEVESNALAGGKRVLSKLECRIRDLEIETEEEKRRHVETQKVLRKKEHRIKEFIVQSEEDHQAITVLNDSVEKLSEKCKMYKRQLVEQEGMSQQNLTRVRRFQRELEAAEERADQAESNLSLIRAKHRSWVTTSQVPGTLRQVVVTEETSSTTSQY